MAKSVGIIAYGSPEDRKKLEQLAKLAGLSGSQWLIQMIREKHKEIFG